MRTKSIEEVAKSEAFEFRVDYKPFETDLDYSEYAEYGFERGFIYGFSAHKKETDKIILDKLNKLRSDLSYEQKVKLTKVISKDKIEALKLQIELLIEIQNKLK